MKSISKRIISLFLALAMVVLVVPFGTFSITAFAGIVTFDGGTGTIEDPYLISTKEQLDAIRNDLTASYKLIADIVFEDSDFEEGGGFYNEGAKWIAIGDGTSNFSGTLDGDGHIIKNLQIDTSVKGVGLFGYATDADFKNLGLVDCKIESTISFVGGICGCASGSTIDNCYFTGSIYAYYGGYYVGGICGSAETSNTTITNCYNLGQIRGSSSVGGICGCSYSLISGCYNAGRISTAEGPGGDAGGICGFASKITNCYNTGDISSGDGAGGICDHGSVITNCYNVGRVVCDNDYYGALCSNSDVTITNCYYLDYINKNGPNRNSDYPSNSLEELKDKETYVGFDFESVWEIDETSNYPFPTLKAIKHIEDGIENTTDFDGGNGKYYNPYKVLSKEQLDNIRNDLSAYYKLTQDIIFEDSDFKEGGVFYNKGEKWIPIGDSSVEFTGGFDGDGHTITNLQVNSTKKYAGLFGQTKESNICNLGITSGNIVSNNEYSTALSGVFIAMDSGSTITNCYNNANVLVKGGKSGGICALTSNTTVISNCYNTGSINVKGSVYTSEYTTGGICGSITNSTIINCYNNGTIEINGPRNSVYVGGVCGYVSDDSAVENCYNTGSISDEGNKSCWLGGICGNAYYSTITNCYNNGTVEISESKDVVYMGGICGNAYYSTITNCYNKGSITGKKTVGGICGANPKSTIDNCYNMGNVKGTFDVGGICGCSGKLTIKNCYNVGSIDGNEYVGGICGSDFSSGAITNCYNVGSIDGNEYVGGICGLETSSSTVSNCYYYMNSYGSGIGCYEDEGTDTCIACTFDELKNQATFVDFDFDTVWEIDGTSKYTLPTLKGIKQTECVNHFWSGTVTEKATCTKDGILTYSCEVCGETMTEAIPKTGHKYGSWQKYSSTKHKRVCKNDSSHVEYASHTWNSGVVTKKATCTTTGVKTYTCTKCGATKTETIAKTAHKYSSTTKKCSCGKVNPSYTGLIKNSNGSYTYYVKGVASTKTGLVKMPSGSPQAGKYVYLKSGVFQSSYTGLVKEGSKYKYVVKGIFTTKTGSVKIPSTSTYYKNKTVKLKSGIKV